MEFILSERGAKLITFKNFTFRKDKDVTVGVRFRCTNKNCKASITVDHSEKTILHEAIEHNHEMLQNLNIKKIQGFVKRKATDDLQRPAKNIVLEAISTNCENVTVEDVANIRRSVYRQRRSILPPLPSNIETFNSDLPIEHVDVGSTSCEETTDPDLDFLPESDEPSLPKRKRQNFVVAKDTKTYCRLCLNPATKNQMVCLGDFHDINYPSRTEQFKRNKILQTDMYLRMIITLMPNFNHDLVYNPIMCNGCSTRLQMASDFVEQCMATQNLIQQYKDTYCPAEKLVSCEDVVHNKSHLQPANNQAVPSNPKKRKIAKPVPQQPTETVSYNEEFQTLENVNVKTEQFEEMENEEKYEITPEEVCNIKQEFVEEETMIRTNETEITLPVDTVVKNEPCSTEISDYNIVANEQTSIKQFSNSNIDIPTTEVDSIYNTNLVGTHVPAQFCPPTLPPQYCPPNQPVASETFVSLVNPVTTQSVASNNVDLSHNYQNS